MFFPLRDEKSYGKPFVTTGLIIANVCIFLLMYFSGFFADLVYAYGAVPVMIVNGMALHTLFTSMFMHAGFAHLIGNMWYLWIFGNNLEWACGRSRFLTFFVLTGLMGSLAHIATNPASTIPAIGASGAISGILGGYIVLFPHNRIVALLALGYIYRVVAVPAYMLIGLWFLYQFLMSTIVLAGAQVGVAYLAHFGGFVGGMMLINVFKIKKIRRRKALIRL